MTTEATLPAEAENHPPAVTPDAMLQAAIHNGMDPAGLEHLTTIYERWQENQARQAFAVAMHACQKAMPVVVRDAENTHTRSRYARLENVQKQCKPVYSDHGFSLSFGEAESHTPDHKRTVCDVRHVGGHCERYHIDLPIDGTGAKGGAIAMNKLQGHGSTLSYAQRYLLCMIFSVTVADHDDDGNGDAPVPSVSENQAIVLQDIGGQLDNATLQRALKWAQVESWYDLPAARFEEVKGRLAAALKRKVNG